MGTRLKEKVVIITGGAGLLGEQHARAVAKEGANIVLADVDKTNAENLAEVLSSNYDIHADGKYCDVTDVSSVEALREWTIDVFGQVDVLINNAAKNPKVEDNKAFGRMKDMTIEAWRHDLDVGLTGAFLCSCAFGEQMAEKGKGVILNIASDLSVIAPDQRIYSYDSPKPVSYSVVKHGLIGLTRYLATYWASEGIRVNAISPGGVENYQPQEFQEKLNKLIPMGRMARVDEYRAAVVFLVSDDSSYMTGQNLIMDGGRSVW